MCGLDRLAERFRETPRQSRRRLHRDLLTENGAQCQLESVEGPRQPQSGIPRDGIRQESPHELRDDDVGPRAHVEEIPEPAQEGGEPRCEGTGHLHHQGPLPRVVVDVYPPGVRAELCGSEILGAPHPLDVERGTIVQPPPGELNPGWRPCREGHGPTRRNVRAGGPGVA